MSKIATFQGLFALFVIVLASIQAQAVSLDSSKQGRSSSLIPFPRVGRSVGLYGRPERPDIEDRLVKMYYGEKRTGKSSLIPFPRVGRQPDHHSLVKFERLRKPHNLGEAAAGLGAGHPLYFNGVYDYDFYLQTEDPPYSY